MQGSKLPLVLAGVAFVLCGAYFLLLIYTPKPSEKDTNKETTAPVVDQREIKTEIVPEGATDTRTQATATVPLGHDAGMEFPIMD